MDWVKLKKVLGMLGSSHDGERLAALNRAVDMLRLEGLTFVDVVGPSQEARIKELEDQIREIEYAKQKDVEYFQGMVNQLKEQLRGKPDYASQVAHYQNAFVKSTGGAAGGGGGGSGGGMGG